MSKRMMLGVLVEMLLFVSMAEFALEYSPVVTYSITVNGTVKTGTNASALIEGATSSPGYVQLQDLTYPMTQGLVLNSTNLVVKGTYAKDCLNMTILDWTGSNAPFYVNFGKTGNVTLANVCLVDRDTDTMITVYTWTPHASPPL